jgi:RimJ/RimL family protein N-acetyltransferase
MPPMSAVPTDDDLPPGRLLPVVFGLRDGRDCVLRGMTEEDAKELCEFLPNTHAESDFLNYFPGEFDKTIEQEREFIREHNAKPCSISMAAELDGHIVGIAGAASPEQRRFAHHAECGLTVSKALWGLGIGRKMMEHLIDWGRGRGLRKMYLKVRGDNDRATRLYRSLGFKEEGRLRGDVLRGDGSYGDTVIMARHYVD